MKRTIFHTLIAALLLICSCAGPQNTSSEAVQKDSVSLVRNQHDSTFIYTLRHDSIYIHERGDTVIIEKHHIRYIDASRSSKQRDSIYITLHDTVRTTTVRTEQKAATFARRIPYGIATLLVILILLYIYNKK